MKAVDADAIARFIRGGGKVLKINPPVPVTEQQVLSYIGEYMGKIRYFPGDLKPYACCSRRYSVDGLVRLANSYRAVRKLPPFMLAHLSSVTRSSDPSDSYHPLCSRIQDDAQPGRASPSFRAAIVGPHQANDRGIAERFKRRPISTELTDCRA